MNFNRILLSSVVYQQKRFVTFSRTRTLTRNRTRNLLNRFEYEWDIFILKSTHTSTERGLYAYTGL
jgi:hypothetical protein